MFTYKEKVNHRINEYKIDFKLLTFFMMSITYMSVK